MSPFAVVFVILIGLSALALTLTAGLIYWAIADGLRERR